MALTKARNRMITGAQVNVKDFGATGDGTTDDTVAIQAAIDSIDKSDDYITGGVVYFPSARYKISAPLLISGGGAENLASVTLQGEGIHNTIIDVASNFVGDRAISVLNSTYSSFKDFQVLGNNVSSYGIVFEAGSEIYVERVFSQNHSIAGFFVKRCFMMTMNQCRTKGGVTGYDFGGGYNTSLSINNCYALNTTAGGQGFNILDVSYSNFTSCGADSTGLYGYKISNTAGVSFVSCGAEESIRAAFYIQASSTLDTDSVITHTRCTLDNCFSKGADDAATVGYGSIYTRQFNVSLIDVEVNRFYEFDVDGGISVNCEGALSNHVVRLNNCRFTGAIRGNAAVVNQIDVVRSEAVSITTANTPVLNLASVFGTTLNYSGILHVVATNAESDAPTPMNLTAYVLLVTKSTAGSSVVQIAANGLTTGGSATQPSFTWTIDETNNQLEATPISSTSGTFFFNIGQVGALNITQIGDIA